MTGVNPLRAWPFLIARGRRKGYSVLLAPNFLVAGREYGFLEDVAGPTSQDRPVRIEMVDSPRGNRLCLVWTEYRVRHADVAAIDARNGTSDPVDEHSRPLRLLHGFLSTDTRVTEAARADLDQTRGVALDAYRRFLADEENFTVEESSPIEITSSVSSKRPTEPAIPAPRDGRGLPAVKLLAAAALLAILVIFGLQLLPDGLVHPGDTVDGRIEQSGQVDSYELDLRDSTEFRLAGVTGFDKGLRVNLVGPSDCDPIPDDYQYCVQQGAQYQLKVSGEPGATGPYEFTLVTTE